MTGTLQVKLPHQPAIITTVGNKLGNDRRIRWKTFVPVSRVVYSRRVHPGHETGATRRTNGALTIGMGESHATSD